MANDPEQTIQGQNPTQKANHPGFKMIHVNLRPTPLGNELTCTRDPTDLNRRFEPQIYDPTEAIGI
jgi:hypothetical protein